MNQECFRSGSGGTKISHLLFLSLRKVDTMPQQWSISLIAKDAMSRGDYKTSMNKNADWGPETKQKKNLNKRNKIKKQWVAFKRSRGDAWSGWKDVNHMPRPFAIHQIPTPRRTPARASSVMKELTGGMYLAELPPVQNRRLVETRAKKMLRLRW